MYYLEYSLLKAEERKSLSEQAPRYSGSFLMELGLALPFVSSTRGLTVLNSALASCDDVCAHLALRSVLVGSSCKSSVSGVSSWAGWKSCVEGDICGAEYTAQWQCDDWSCQVVSL